MEWQERFQGQLALGKTVQEAANYANSFMYVDPDNTQISYTPIKQFRIYGNPNLTVAPSVSSDSTSTDLDYVDLSEEGIPYSHSAAKAAIWDAFHLVIEDYALLEDSVPNDIDEILTSYDSDKGDFVVDFPVSNVAMLGYPEGFTVIVQDNLIIGIRNNMPVSMNNLPTN